MLKLDNNGSLIYTCMECSEIRDVGCTDEDCDFEGFCPKLNRVVDPTTMDEQCSLEKVN